MKIAVIGTGYVGLVTGVSLASFGHSVVCVGRNVDKITDINGGKSPFYEPGLDLLLQDVLRKKQFRAVVDLQRSLSEADISILAVGTPTIDNKIDLSEIKEAAKQIGEALRGRKTYHVVVVKSTVIPTTTEIVVKPLLEKHSGKTVGEFGLCMSPEFLREGNAVEDALHPDRVVIGQYDKKSGKTFARLFKKLHTPIIFTNLQTAEMIKYAANSLFATLISYANEIARITETVPGIDVVDVWKGVHLDRRISPGTSHYIYSGVGFGGSCLPKDTKALLRFASLQGIDAKILKSVIDINTTQPQRIIVLLKEALGDLKKKRIALLGLAFKPNTDDLRESASLAVLDLLLFLGATVVCHDPRVNKNNKRFKDLPITMKISAADAIEGADAVVLLTAWDEYKKLTPDVFRKKMRKPVLIDGRRVFEKEYFEKSGIIYKGIGL